MVQSTEYCLRKIVGQASLNHNELVTVIIEIESIINSHLFSYVSAEDTEEPLTPSIYWLGGESSMYWIIYAPQEMEILILTHPNWQQEWNTSATPLTTLEAMEEWISSRAEREP